MVTGANGFVGRSLVRLLPTPPLTLSMASDDWPRAAAALPLRGATVFHLAARVHDASAGEAEFVHDNQAKTRELANIAARRGARRLVLLSTIKVNGEESSLRPFSASDAPAPRDAYARSKLAAEEALHAVSRASPLEAVVLRAPLVYGRGAAGNLAALLRLADSALPLPFASIRNRRSFIHVDDLAAALIAAASAAAGRTYLVAHSTPVSTPQLVSLLRDRLQRPRRLFAMPPGMLEAAATLAGQRERALRLTRSLEIEASAAQRELSWTARRNVEEAVADLVAGHREGAGR